MMKKKKLKKWVKVVLSIMILGASIYIYSKTNTWGTLAQDSKFYEGLTVLSWLWLILVPVGGLSLLWED